MFNVITPLARYKNLNKLIDMLNPKKIKWHIITDEDSGIKIETDEKWIKHYICPNNQVQFFERCNFAINWFIDTQEIIDNEFYCILNDDDSYEPDFFDKILKIINYQRNINKNEKVLLCSMERGDNTPSDAIPVRQHPTFKLWALPDRIGVGMTGIEQIILTGEILKKYRLPLLCDGDGRFISHILSENKCLLMPEVNVLFNYFEPGRWNNV